MNSDVEALQHAVCRKYAVEPFPTPLEYKVGISRTVQQGLTPINGMRLPPCENTTGWYIWAGEELSGDSDFFVPLHVAHLASWCLEALPFLLLPPGWRFLMAGDYVDVWFDQQLLTRDIT